MRKARTTTESVNKVKRRLKEVTKSRALRRRRGREKQMRRQINGKYGCEEEKKKKKGGRKWVRCVQREGVK